MVRILIRFESRGYVVTSVGGDSPERVIESIEPLPCTDSYYSFAENSPLKLVTCAFKN